MAYVCIKKRQGFVYCFTNFSLDQCVLLFIQCESAGFIYLFIDIFS
jgi:hypothetical protein